MSRVARQHRRTRATSSTGHGSGAALTATGLVAAALLCALPAAAQQADSTGASGRGEHGAPAQSPQNTAFELRIGRYVPAIDNEFQTARPYEQTFGTKNRYSVGFEVDWQALRIPYLGTFGPGIGLEYTKITGRSFDSLDPTLQTRAGPGEDSSLKIFPMYAVGVLRADYLARQFKIPLVPYAKLGVGAALWSVSTGEGTARQGGVTGNGLSYGPQFALGGMFLLDTIDPTSAIEMDANTGVNNSYFFVEWYVSQLNGFGAGNQLQVGTNTWVLGLALEI